MSFFKYSFLKLIVFFIRLVVPTKYAWESGPTQRLVRIPSRDQNRFIDAHLYQPPQRNAKPMPSDGASAFAAADSSSDGPKAILVNWHGSGFVPPMLGSDHEYCLRVACETGITVLDADYRKAPENPFPAALEDVEDVLRWVGNQSQQFDITRVAVSGFSAGGNLALVAASALRGSLEEQSGLQIPVVIAVYPPTDISIDPGQKMAPKPIKPIPSTIARIFDNSYAPDVSMRKDPRVSPGLADAFSFPNAVVIFTCEGDKLAPEANALAKRLEDGKRKVVNRTLPGMCHQFDKRCKDGSKEWEQREICYGLIVTTLKEVLQV